MEGINWNEMSDSELAQIYDDSSVTVELQTVNSPEIEKLSKDILKLFQLWTDNLDNPSAEICYQNALLLFMCVTSLMNDQSKST